MSEKVAILDCGAQYAKVIDRRVRELAVESDILPHDTPARELAGYRGIIISGGPDSVYEQNAPHCDPGLLGLGVPLLGICYGMQWMNLAMGGTVAPRPVKEYGETRVSIDATLPLFAGLSNEEQVLMSHGDSLAGLAHGFKVVARSGEIVAAIADESRAYYGVQFHPEVELTTHGTVILKNFLYGICGLEGTYTMENRIEKAVAEISAAAGHNNVLVLVSGGVDSAVTAALLLRALNPGQVYAIHVDSGFMRHDESAGVMESLKVLGLRNFRLVQGADEFLDATTQAGDREIGPLSQTTDPEEKRRIIGDCFMRIVAREIERMGLSAENTYLAQGTLRPDLIESASEVVTRQAQTIKTHHNDSPLVRELRSRGRVIETNKDWHKDEVRQVGLELGLPESLVWRQPFPGPGLATRIICAREPYTPAGYAAVSQKVAETARRFGCEGALMPVRTVGVQGDGRSYGFLAAVAGSPEWNQLRALAAEITRTVHEVNRVVYLPAALHVPFISEIVPTLLSKDTAGLLRRADHYVRTVLEKNGVYNRISQVIVTLFPVDLTGNGGVSVGLRPFMTNDYMTGSPASFPGDIPFECVLDMVRGLQKMPGIGGVAYDLTSKPPATMEWE